MVPKRHICEEGAGLGASIREPKRRLTFPGFVRDAMKGLSLHEFAGELEPFVQRVVREEVENAILRFFHSSSRPSPNHIDSSSRRAWQLHFDSKVPSMLFTGNRIESDDSTPLRILILDACSKEIISSGVLSSVKIEICVLDGDFGADDQEDWTEKEFDAYVVREREGKRPLLTGERLITLRNGVGYIGEISFTDNSSWTRSRKFRLGARVLNTAFPELRIREARSEAFVVKDHRGESYRKHYPPFLGDDIWRLEKIAKDGSSHRKLAANKVYTVKDFLRLYVTDPSALRSILGSGISNKIWETITEHAMTSILDDREFYLYYRTAERIGIVLNCIYKVVGATFDGHNFHSLDKLTSIQMHVVKNLKRYAYLNLNELVLFCDQSFVALLGAQADPVNNASLNLHQGYLPFEEQDDSETLMRSLNHMGTPPFNFEVANSNQMEISTARNCHLTHTYCPTQGNSLLMRDICSGSHGEGSIRPTSGSLVPVVQPDQLFSNDTFPAEMSTWLPVTTSWGQESGLLYGPGSEAEDGIQSSLPNFSFHISRNRKPKAGWCKLRAALKWRILARRYVAAKKMAKHLYVDM